MKKPNPGQMTKMKALTSHAATTELTALRQRIDDLDQTITASLHERLAVAAQMARLKMKLGLPIEDALREAQVLGQVLSHKATPEISQAMGSIYQAIIEQSKQLQKPPDLKARARSPLYFPRVLIIGLGLIGSTLARQIKRLMPETTLLGVDSPDVLAQALSDRVIDAGFTEVGDALSKTALIILAASPEQNLELLAKIAPHLSRRQLVLDVTSTKGKICALAEQLDLKGADFVGGHPLFGSEKSGYSGSKQLNPDGQLFCLVPTSKTLEMSLRRLCRWLTTLNLNITITDAATHDRAIAKLSHVVQILAVVLGGQVTEGLSDKELKAILALSGTSFKQIARLMGSPLELWKEILLQNQTQVVPVLEDFARRLKDISTVIDAKDTTQLEEFFRQAKRVWDSHAI
ncbi:MAG: prephenate dehydrogenase/arogenate dehydrogenase family protein [Candidatus Melainabacteria bacterium]|nr:prephenate dehydrogenase/arogenate dehydrogenase family protein [Candidatus Melainabacteria bacterium]